MLTPMIFHIIKSGSQTGYKFSLLDYILSTIFCYIDIRQERFTKEDFIEGCRVATSGVRVATYSVLRDAAKTSAKKRVLDKLVKCPSCGNFKHMTLLQVINGSIPENCACGLTGSQIIDGMFKTDKMLSTLWSNPLVSEGHNPSAKFKEDCGYDLRGI